jgi:hypothetical protein
LRAFGTAVEALRRRGISEPGDSLAWIRGWRTTSLLVKNGRFDAAEVATIRNFCRERGFDLDWLPGIRPEDVNRFAVLERPWFYEGAAALLGSGRDAFLREYKFDVRPVTDDQPYFFNSLKLATLWELFHLPERAGFNLVEWGYPVLLATLAQAIAASVGLVLLPLLALSGRGKRWTLPAGTLPRTAVYFAALGLGFLFVEIGFINKLQLFLGHPSYAIATALAAFLIFAGLGSSASAWLAKRSGSRRRAVRLAVVGVGAFVIADLLLVADVLPALMALPSAAKMAIAVTVIAPLAFCMGMPFPLGLAATALAMPPLVPWAWAINGCASVVSAVLAPVLALHLGFSWVLLGAVALYGLAALTFPGSGGSRSIPGT